MKFAASVQGNGMLVLFQVLAGISAHHVAGVYLAIELVSFGQLLAFLAEGGL